MSDSEEDIFLAVLDFEATCDNKGQLTPQEIIEFPVVLVNASKGQTIDVFHSYCRPTAHPKLTKFCMDLTGISQAQVDTAPLFPQVLASFQDWLRDQVCFFSISFLTLEELEEDEIAFVTCGDWDLGTMLPDACARYKLEVPTVFHQWIDLKSIFQTAYNLPRKKKPSFKQMMEYLVLPIQGRHHSGKDDALNMASIIFQMKNDGLLDKFEITSSL